ncbi:MAG: RNA polymerase sigma factor [Bacillota bacterium]|nr:RNA polymerase sigma factor [Bacillota bacterium]
MDVKLMEALIERMSDGYEDAFERIYSMYMNKVYNTARMMTEDEKAAEDILQEVFIIIYKKIYKLKHAEAFESWLYRITVNCCNNYFKKRKSTVVTEDDKLADVIGADTGQTPGEELISRETNDEIYKAVNTLPGKYRECIILYYYSEMSIAQIADVLDCSAGTVKSNLFKAKKALKKKLNLEIDCEVKTYGYR